MLVTTLDDEVGGAADNIMPSEDKPPDHSFDNGGTVKSSSTRGLVPVERGSEVTTGPIVSLSERGTSPVPSLQDTGTSTGPIMVDTRISTLPEMKEVATTISETEFKQLVEEPKPTITDDTMAAEELDYLRTVIRGPVVRRIDCRNVDRAHSHINTHWL